MTEKIILSIVSIVMLILTIQKKDKYSIVLTSGLTIGILATWIKIPQLFIIGMLIYMITALLITFYGVRKKELSKSEKVIISLMGIMAFLANLFEMNHYPFASEMRLSMILPLILYIVLIVKGMIKKKEFGFLTILNLSFLLRFMRYWN